MGEEEQRLRGRLYSQNTNNNACDSRVYTYMVELTSTELFIMGRYPKCIIHLQEPCTIKLALFIRHVIGSELVGILETVVPDCLFVY